MIIHSLYIIRQSGVPVYQRDYSIAMKNVDPNLLSSFFTAIISFSRAVILKEIDVLDVGDLRFFFENSKELTFILVTDTSYSVLLVRERLKLIGKAFFERFGSTFKNSDQVVEDKNFDQAIDAIIHLKDDYSPNIMQPVQQFFADEILKGNFIAGALLSMTGTIYYSSLPAEYLHTSLKEIEIRIKTDATTRFKKRDMPKLILQLGNRLIFSQSIFSEKLKAPVLVVLLFDATTNLGMADFTLETLLKELEKML
jgi:hypothetical protein